MTHEEFIEAVAEYVIKYAPQYGILVNSPIIAQAILESNWGDSKLSAQTASKGTLISSSIRDTEI